MLQLKRLMWCYFTPKPFESSLYQRIGVPLLGRYCPNGGSRFSLTKSFIKKRQSRLDVLRDFLKTTIIGESIHVVIAAVLIWQMINAYLSARYEVAVLNLGMNVAINAFPIMLQRYNRARVLPAIYRRRRRSRRQPSIPSKTAEP